MIEFVEVSTEFVDKLQKTCESELIQNSIFVFSKEDPQQAVSIDLQEWILASEENKFGIKFDQFFIKIVE